MDSVRFGRALGAGTRAVAKALVQAADAATAPNPSAPGPTPATPKPPQPKPLEPVQQRVSQTARGVREGSRRFGQAMLEPATRLTNVIWLEVTGVFFSLFAITGAAYCWKNWHVVHGGSADEQHRLWIMAAMTAVFGYFCITSFVRAKRRARR